MKHVYTTAVLAAFAATAALGVFSFNHFSGSGQALAAHHEAAEEGVEIPDYEALLSAPGREDFDKNRDASRKPAAILAKVGLKPGDVVIDIGAGSGYYSEIFARVAGPEGAVYAVNTPGILARFSQITPNLAKRVEAVKPAVLHPLSMEFQEIPPKNADLVFMGQMYHEVVLQNMAAAAINEAIFRTLRPGGYYVIEIHRAREGAGRAISEETHRTDPAIVREEVSAAGFELIEENVTLLDNPEDPLDSMVFGEEIRGRTARTVFIFQKPE